jgi:RimJ/RimL family protein N-acetyltransferase
MTASIPHPYPDGAAEEWISSHQAGFEEGTLFNYAIVLKESGQLVGAIGLGVRKGDHRAEIGYWVGKPYWNRGYCTEAGRVMIAFGFEALELNRIQGRYMATNPASGRVLEKLGMVEEGTHRQVCYRFGSYHDLVMCSILREEYEAGISGT